MTVEEIIEKVKSVYTPIDILDMFDNECAEWDYGYSEEEIEDEWGDHLSFYADINNNEAEDAIVERLLMEVGTSANALVDFHKDFDDLEQFKDWLSVYTMHVF